MTQAHGAPPREGNLAHRLTIPELCARSRDAEVSVVSDGATMSKARGDVKHTGCFINALNTLHESPLS